MSTKKPKVQTAADTPEDGAATPTETSPLDALNATTNSDDIIAALKAIDDKNKAEVIQKFLVDNNKPSTQNAKVTFKTFDNKDPKMTGHLWMWQTEGTIQQYNLTDAQALAQVRIALVGDPGRWFSCVLQDEDNPDSQIKKWSDFKTAFKKRYVNAENFTQQLKMFQSCRQRHDESAATFHDRCIQITKRMVSELKNGLPLRNPKGGRKVKTEWNKKGIEMTQTIYQKMLFISGLHEDLRLHMEETATTTDNITDILEKATKFEKAKINSMPNLAATNDIASFGQRPQKFPGKPSTVIVDGIRKPLCLKCGNYGHMQYSCTRSGQQQPNRFRGRARRATPIVRTNNRPQFQARTQTSYTQRAGYRRGAQMNRGGQNSRGNGRRYRLAGIEEEPGSPSDNLTIEN